MNARQIALPLLLFCLWAMIPVTLVHGSEEACSSKETIYPKTSTTIRDEAGFSGRLVRYTVPWEPLEVTESKRESAWCWLQISDGWIVDSALLSSVALRDTESEQPDSIPSDCYQGDTAHIAGAMNIRASATIESLVVANARAGDSFEVTQSDRGETWCWLKVSQGWLANTSRVSAKKITPVVAVSAAISPPVTQQSDVDNCCFVDRQCATEQEWTDGYWAYQNGQCGSPTNITPTRPRIEGSPAFVRWIEGALSLLAARTPYWYDYVISQTNVIVEVPDPDGPRICTARVNQNERRIMVETDCRTFDSKLSFIAGVLAHEACHVYHYDQGITYPEGPLREEWECGKPGLAVSNALGATGNRHMPWEEYIAWMNTDPFN